MFAKFLLLASLAVATVNATTVQIFSDSTCTTSTGSPVILSTPSLSECQMTAPGSVFHECSNSQGLTRFFHQVYQSSNDCNAIPIYSFHSENNIGGCATMSAVGPNETEIKGWVRITCEAGAEAGAGSMNENASVAAEEIYSQIKSIQ